ncbi:MAG: PilZ domain-containing protein [Pseudomonadota bacterium]
MSAAVPQADRRNSARLACNGLAVTLRVRGQWFSRPATALDFNAEGIAVLWPSPLVKDRLVFLTLALGAQSVEDVVGVVHNCTSHEDSYRLGIRFRLESELQLDAPLVRQNVQRIYRASRGTVMALAAPGNDPLA